MPTRATGQSVLHSMKLLLKIIVCNQLFIKTLRPILTYLLFLLILLPPIVHSIETSITEQSITAQPTSEQSITAQVTEQNITTETQIILEVFVRDGCPHCAAAKRFLPDFARQRPNLKIILRPVDKETNARDALIQHSRNADIWPPGVPTFVIQNKVLAGFDTAETSGPKLAKLVDGISINSETIESSLLGTLSVDHLGLPAFTLALGLLDGFNPCAMWVLLFLLSLLVHLNNRKRMALIAGTFVLVSGAVYYAFMAAWLNLFLLVGLSTFLRLTLACLALTIGAINVKDFFSKNHDFSLSIPDSAKPGLYARMRTIMNAKSLLPALIGVAALAVAVNFIELLCTAGLPAIYTAVLTQQQLSPSAHYAYLGLYILGYMADDAMMVSIAVFALSSRKLSIESGRWLKLLSGTVMIAIGIIMMLHPEWLMG